VAHNGPMRCVAFIVLALLPLTGGGTARGAELATRETPVGRLALPVVPDSTVVSPDSSRLVLAAKSGDATLEEKGVIINPKPTDPRNDSARPQLNEICLYIDDKQTIPFDSTTVPVFSPDSKRLGYAGRHGKTWQLVLDGKTLMPDADDVPAVPIAFSPDSAHVAWVVQKGEQYRVTVDESKWPPLEAAAVGAPQFSPDSRHVALAARIRTGWTMFVDGAPLPAPTRPATTSAPSGRAATQAASVVQLARFGQFAWRPDSGGLAYHAAFPNATWQFFAQSLDGTIGFTSKTFDGILNASPVFAPDGRQMAFGGSTRNKWSMVTDPALPTVATAPAAAGGGAAALATFDQILPESVAFYRPPGAAESRYTLLYLAQQNKKWRLYVDHRPQADTFDSIILGSFVVAPDRQHYAFAGVRDGKTTVIRDGGTLGTHNECAASSFAFSPDSQHLAYAARSVGWSVCVDGTPGKSFNMMTNSPVAFSPDSTRVAYLALTAQKTWHVIAGKDGELESKPYDAFLKGARLHWRADGTIVTIAIQKKVALRVEATP
jgi:hypothetical protein